MCFIGTQWKLQMMYHRIVHLKPNNFINQCHPYKFNLKIEKLPFRVLQHTFKKHYAVLSLESYYLFSANPRQKHIYL